MALHSKTLKRGMPGAILRQAHLTVEDVAGVPLIGDPTIHPAIRAKSRLGARYAQAMTESTAQDATTSIEAF